MSEHGTSDRYNHGQCRCPECREAIWLLRVERRGQSAANGGVYPGAITHGENGYSNYGCRCRACTDGFVAASNGRRARRRAETEANGGVAAVAVHNVWTQFNYGCQCDVCIQARRDYDAELRAKRRRSVQA